MNKTIFVYVLCVAICLAVGGVGTIFTVPAIPAWYKTLNKPFFTPPAWLFGPVWTTLYVLMGISLGLVYNLKKSLSRTRAMQIFALQLSLNALWSYAFFGLKSPLFGLIVIVVLWLTIFQTIRTFSKLSKPAAQQLIPYLAWVSYASVLNLAIFLLN